MSERLAYGGRLIDRTCEISFTFNGREMKGYAGDTLASGLLANNQVLVGRSFKYHRPRGIVASGPEEPNALMNLGKGSTFEPNARATTTEIFDGLTARSQNHWPSLEFDVGAVNAIMPLAFPAGFYYKTFISPRAAWKHLYEPFIRKTAGLGDAPDAATRDADRYEYFYAHTDVMVVGGGIAGLAAARAAARSGVRVLVMEQSAHWGGRAPVDGASVDGKTADKWVKEGIDELSRMPNVRLRLRMMGTGIYDHGFALGYERLSDHKGAAGTLRHRLWHIRAGRIITATGAIERPLSFAGNDVPGVMLASAVRDYAVNYGVGVGKRVVVATNNDDAYRTALLLKDAKVEVPCIIDARPDPKGTLPEKARAAGIRILAGKAVSTAYGSKRLTSVGVCAQDSDGRKTAEFECDALAMSGGWSPVVHLWSHCGGKLTWDADRAMFRPDHDDLPPSGADGIGLVLAAGTADGEMRTAAVLENAHAAGLRAAGVIAFSDGAGTAAAEAPYDGPSGTDAGEAPMLPVWQMPARLSKKAMLKTWLDYQNDVKVSDVRLAAREGFESVEHTKRYTTLGMATDQGKLSNINGIAILADSLGADIPDVGTTTFRPPYQPVSMGVIAGEAHGTIFKPMRRSPMHDWIDANGGFWEPVADWRRPYCFRQPGESVRDAVTREILSVRENVGLLDASTLGKIIVKGPDAGKFLDMLYTNMMSTLKVGHCRYGLMCSENGFLSDDGVVARLDKDTFLCHTTSGGSDRIHAWMEEWLQTEWWDWKVYTVNVTEQYAQIGIVGPNARRVLEKMGTHMDLSAEALPFMAFGNGKIGGIKARLYRISFSGELSYEAAVPANQAMAFWEKALEAGVGFGITPYGTEALHVMRAEKGFIMIGDETDGTVIPQDLGLNRMISKKKDDFLGKRAQERSFMKDPNRWKLVGLETMDPQEVIPDGAYAVDGHLRHNGVRNMIGRITSTYYSPTLKRSVALGLVERGPDRMGEIITFTNPGGQEIEAKIVDPVFLDKEGARQNV
ncbi:MAG: sarcosine oxidase subunit alpha family protein [Rhodobacteraceae bacterium]|nr:sarcosine oxidase subunit alpha family protein [Paracoccaceae bacterium]